MNILDQLDIAFATRHLLHIRSINPYNDEASITLSYPARGMMTVLLPFFVLPECTCGLTNKLCRTPVYEYCMSIALKTIDPMNVFIMRQCDYLEVINMINWFEMSAVHFRVCHMAEHVDI